MISSVIHQVYISSNIPIPLKNLIIFSTSQSFLSIVLMSHWILCFLLLFLHWGQSYKHSFLVSLWFPHAEFLYVGCSLFFDINFLWVFSLYKSFVVVFMRGSIAKQKHAYFKQIVFFKYRDNKSTENNSNMCYRII